MTTENKTGTYQDILKMIENPKEVMGHFLCETLDEENFVCPDDDNMAIRIYVGDNLITKPHDLNTVLTDWVHRWVKQYLEENYNFTDFRRSVEEEAKKLSKEKSDIFFDDINQLREQMESKLSEAFWTLECLDIDQYAAGKQKDERIVELEAEVARLKAKAGEPVGLKDYLLTESRVDY